MDTEYTCALCGSTYTFTEEEELEAQAELMRSEGLTPDAPGIERICEPCYTAVRVHQLQDAMFARVSRRYIN